MVNDPEETVIQGKVIVITGASSGIGAASARLLAGRGARLVLGARRLDRLQALAAEIAAAGGSAVAMPADVTRREDLVGLTEAAMTCYGRLDVLISNAGSGRSRHSTRFTLRRGSK